MINLIVFGKTNFNFVRQGIDFYLERLKRYTKFNFMVIQQKKYTKKVSIEQQKAIEAKQLEEVLKKYKNIFLLDEKGKEFTSEGFAKFIENQLISRSEITFVIGGAYGFSSDLKYPKISLSKLTFPHDLVRLIFIEQLYRAFTIIKNEKYHH